MSNWPEDTGRLDLGTVDSTNAHAIRLAPWLHRPLWITARSQTRGRGRCGRSWISETGNFHATYTRALGGEISEVARYSFVAALAVRDSVLEFTYDRCMLTLKWPNDVLADDRKVAGILLECITSSGRNHLICGIGINLATSPGDAGTGGWKPRPGSLREAAGITVTTDDLLPVMACAMQKRVQQLVDEGFESIRVDWLGSAAGLGRQVEVRDGNEIVHGVLVTVDRSGFAVVDDGKAMRTFAAADIGLQAS